jgi:cytochrome b6-f complex iron-sulfur subunit
MDRKEFIALVGVAAGGALLVSCFESCKKENEEPANQKVDFTLDLNAPANAALKTNGGFLVNSGVIVAHTQSGAYIAVASACTHQGSTVGYVPSSNQFRCPTHGSVFSSTGAVVTGPAGTALQQFNTTLSGTNLRVFSS